MWCARPNQFLGACSASTAQVYFLSAVPLSCLDVASACFVSYCIWNLVHTCRLSRRASCGELHITLVLKQSCSSFHRKKGKCSLCPGRVLRWHTLSSYCIACLPRLLLVGGPGGNLTFALSCGFPFLCLSRTYPAPPTSLCSRRVCHPVAALCVCVCVSFIVYPPRASRGFGQLLVVLLDHGKPPLPVVISPAGQDGESAVSFSKLSHCCWVKLILRVLLVGAGRHLAPGVGIPVCVHIRPEVPGFFHRIAETPTCCPWVYLLSDLPLLFSPLFDFLSPVYVMNAAVLRCCSHPA